MKPISVLCSVLFAGFMGCTTPQAVPVPSSTVVKAEIQKAIEAFSETSARGDLAGVMAKFDDRADILLVGSDKGEIYQGRAAMEAWLGNLYRSSGFSWQMDRVDISHHGDTAWAFVEGRMNVTSKSTGKLRFSAPYRFSVVFVRKEDRWVLRLFHGSAPAKE